MGHYILKSKPTLSNFKQLALVVVTLSPKSGGLKLIKKSVKYPIDAELNAFQIPEEEIDNQLSDISKFIKDVEVARFVDNEGWIGIEILSIKKNSLLYKCGLRKGDVLMSLNGTIIDLKNKDLKEFSSLRNKESFIMRIRRGNYDHTYLTFQIVGRVKVKNDLTHESNGTPNTIN